MMNNELIPTPMMSFGESVKTCFQKYVTFKGRARRSNTGGSVFSTVLSV